jgi:2-methylcitrate dehydratase PrpD
LLGLSVDHTAGALASSIALSQHSATPGSPAMSSRWLLLGVAAANGVLAVRGARAGLHGGAAADAILSRMTRGLGRRFLFDEIGTKPFPTARQGLAAIEAARGIVDAAHLAASDITEIVVSLPEPQRVIVDRSGLPRSRFDSIVNIRYQIALAISKPERLFDVGRTPPFGSPVLRRLMTRIRLTRARDLESQYPRAWPARVAIQARGRRHVRVVTHPLGDARCPPDWGEIAAKAIRIAAPVAGTSTTERVINEWRAADAAAAMPLFP